MVMNMELMDKVDEYAKKLSINRSAAVSVLITKALEYEELVTFASKIPQVVDDLNKLAEKRGV